MEKKSIKIVRCFDCIDLRKINSQSEFLQNELKKYRTRHLDAVLYTNQTLTRFRLILNLHNTAFLCIPEIDEQSKHSLYLRVSEALAKLAGITRVAVSIDKITGKIKDKVEKQKDSKNEMSLN